MTHTALLHELFDAAATLHPDRLAIELPEEAPTPRSGRRSTTYAALRSWSEYIAALLLDAARERRAGLDDESAVVAILLPREAPGLYAAQLGALRCGVPFVCLEPLAPDGHLASVLADVEPMALISDAAGVRRAAAVCPCPRIQLDDAAPGPGAAPARPAPAPPWPLHDRRLAYLISTSGTTGQPKAVMIEQRSIVNLVRSDLERFQLGPSDRVAQCSSPAYDSSIEETWLAFAAGATLLPLDDETVRLGPDLIDVLRRRRVTVLCPPPTLLRATGCADPMAALPELRLLYVGGEALPQDLADRWSAGRWMENGYGPTECTVTVVRARVRPGEPVAIGRPVPGNSALVLDEALRPVTEGEAGELCIAGLSLARGYRGRPELTAERFPIHPEHGRICRTGDLARRRPDGALEYLGRLDGQVKLRGHRIELGAVEACLEGAPGVRQAGCRVQGEPPHQLLVAHVVPSDRAAPPSAAALREHVRRRLPAHMAPARIALATELPTTAGGKLDRRQLPEIESPSGREPAAPREPTAEARSQAPGASSPARPTIEEAIVAAFAAAVQAPTPPSRRDDFFIDLGGDSLGAVAVVLALRRHPELRHVAVRDLYAAPTAELLASRLGAAQSPADGAASAAPRRRHQRVPPWGAVLVQSTWLLLVAAAASELASAVGLDALPWCAERLGTWGMLLLAPPTAFLALLAWAPMAVAATRLAQAMLVGREAPVAIPVWSAPYLRRWIVAQMASLIPWTVVEGTVLHGAVLRCLGARVGARVHLGRGVDLRRGGWSLLEIGDDATLARDVAVQLQSLEDGHLVIAPVRIGAGATIEVRATIGGGAAVGAGGSLGALAWLRPGETIPPGERWEGVPARRIDPAPRLPSPRSAEGPEPQATGGATPAGARRWTAGRHAVATLTLRLLAVWTSSLAALLPLGLGLAALAERGGAFEAADLGALVAQPSLPLLAVAAISAVVAVPLSLLCSGLAMRVLGPVSPGVYDLWGLVSIRVWLRLGAVDSAGRWLSGTLFWPCWLRLAGMRIGPRCEISTLIDTLPESVEVGAESFFADGIYVCPPEVHRGTIAVRRTVLGPGSFLGNHAVVPAGVEYPAGLFVGVSTVAPAHSPPASAWFGNPPMRLPRREEVAGDPATTLSPSPIRRVNRVLWESARALLPVPLLAAAFAWLALAGWLERTQGAAALRVAGLAACSALVAAALLGTVVATKWILLGRVRPGQHPLWSCWCSRWDFLYVAWAMLARPIAERLEGTPMLNVLLRLVGTRVGRHVVLGRGASQIVDPDMLRFDDGATVDGHVQAHSFEDRVLKIDRVRVGAEPTVGENAVLFYGVDVGDASRVNCGAVVMKRDRLAPGGEFEGHPSAARRAAADA